jgi:hypothetical protein
MRGNGAGSGDAGCENGDGYSTISTGEGYGVFWGAGDGWPGNTDGDGGASDADVRGDGPSRWT